MLLNTGRKASDHSYPDAGVTYYHTCKRPTAERVLLLSAGREASDHSYRDAGVSYYHILSHLQKAYGRMGVTVECRQASQ